MLAISPRDETVGAYAEHGALDIEVLAMGYLRSPEGKRTRHIPALERIGADMRTLGVRAYWAQLPGNMPGACDCRERVILLARWMATARGEFVTRVLAHELGHIMAGNCEQRADRWQLRLYGSMLVSEWD